MDEPDDQSITTPCEAPDDGSTRVQPSAPAHPFGPGLPEVPGYTVVREIARGGMGAVYLAHDAAFEREVAVKVMHAGQDGARFVVESKVTAQLPHPGVPPVYALGELPDGRPFLVMKLVEGHTLADEIASAGPRLVGAFERICETVGFAHSKGIVHRDLKPANVMVGAFGEVLVMDWGLAKQLRIADCGLRIADSAPSNPQSQETTAGAVKGTPAYMAPEQARGEPVDARADVFALGGILSAILTGKAPFGGRSALEAANRAARGDLAECFERLDRCGADPELIAVAKRCLAAKPDERFADGAAVAVAMSDYRRNVEEQLRAVERERAAAAERRKKRRAQAGLAAAVVALIVGAGAGAWYYRWQQERRRLDAEQARAGVQDALVAATGQRKADRFYDARVTLSRAATAARHGAPELLPEVERAQADLDFVAELDGVRIRKWVPVVARGGKGRFDTAAAPPAYRRALAARGYDPLADPPAEAAARIAASAVAGELVAALDDWAVYEPDPAARDRLLAVASAIDPDPWRGRLRAALGRPSRPVADALAREVVVGHPPAALAALAELVRQTGGDPGELLAAGRAAHPADFELALALGQFRPRGSAARVGAFEAARALRPDSLAAWINLSNALGEAGDIDGELAACRRVLDLAPRLALAHDNYGVALFSRGDLDGAAAAHTRAIELDPQHASPYINRGVVAYERGEYATAIRDYTAAIERQPTSVEAHNNLANARLAAGDVTGAAAAVRRALELDPSDSSSRSTLGSVLKAQGDLAGAVRECRAALRGAPNSALYHTNLGDALLATGEHAAAAVHLRMAIDFKPDLALAHNNLGVTLAATGDHAVALVPFREAIRLAPRVARYHNNLALSLAATGDSAGAIAACREAVRLDPAFARAHWNLADQLLAAGDTSGAIAQYRKAVVADPRDAEAYNNLGTALRHTRDAMGALAAFDRALELAPVMANAHANRGAVLSDRGDLDGAIAAYRAALRVEPNNAPYHYNLATAYLKQNRYPEAAAVARRAAELQPTYAQAHALSGFALQQTGDLLAARAALTAAARLDPARWRAMLTAVPPDPVMPPPRPVKP